MIIGHPGSWQQFQLRLDNKNLSVMEMKSKYLQEQYLFEAQTLNQIHQHNLFMNSVGGGGNYNEPTITYYGMYINGFSLILGDSSAETSLVNFIQNKEMNDLTFYMSNLLDTSQNRTYMRSLALRLRDAGQSRILSNVTQAVNCIGPASGTEATYNNGCSDDREKFTGFTQEWEFWNNSIYGDFDTFKTNDIDIYNYCQANNMTYDIYVSKCEDSYGAYTPEQVATHVVQYHDIVHLVNYVSEVTYNNNKGLNNTRKTQLELLGNAALALGKKQKVTILWAANGNSGVNMRDWFVANPNLNAYTGFMTEYNNWLSSAKAGLDIVGQKIYAYSGISDL